MSLQTATLETAVEYHAGVDDHELPRAAAFSVQHFRQHDPRIAGDVTARLQGDAVGLSLDQRQQRLGMFGERLGLMRILVIDAEPTAQVQPLDLEAPGGQAIDQLVGFGYGINVWLNLVYRGTDVQVKATEIKADSKALSAAAGKSN